MFDIGASELLLIVIVAVVVIGPKDLPLALRTAGRWIGGPMNSGCCISWRRTPTVCGRAAI